MGITVSPELVARAQQGDLLALDTLLRQIQTPLYNLAVRMLGRRDDAQDATQEVLLKITTHLGTWRAESAFGTWAFAIASHHLLNLRARSPARHEISLDELAERLDRGLSFAQRVDFDERVLTPEEKLEAQRTALACTQAMLMCLDAPGRLAYVLDEIFGLDSSQAAAVQGISAAAHRQRLTRARRAVHGFMAGRCGLMDAAAPCRCARQLPGKRAAAAKGYGVAGLEVGDADLAAAGEGLRDLVALGNAAAVMRASPQYAAPEAMLQGIRLVVQHSGMLRQ